MLNNLNDQEKSAMLAKAMGWKVTALPVGHDDLFIIVPNEYDRNIRSFYSPANMSLAWKVLNWATEYERKNNEELVMWWMDVLLCNYPPADAQRLWLDKILELAIEDGLAEVDDE